MVTECNCSTILTWILLVYPQNVIGRVVEGVGMDSGTNFVCGCGVGTSPTA